MGHIFGGYDWSAFQDEAGNLLILRETGTTDDIMGTLYVDRGGKLIWLNTRTPAEAPSERYQTVLATPVFVSITPSNTGGTLTNAHGAYGYRVAALAANGTTTLAFAEHEATIAAGTTGSIKLVWDKTLGAAQYAVYGRTPAGELLMATVPDSGEATTSYVDTGAATPSGALPASNTTDGTSFVAYEDFYTREDNGIPWLESVTVPNI